MIQDGLLAATNKINALVPVVPRPVVGGAAAAATVDSLAPFAQHEDLELLPALATNRPGSAASLEPTARSRPDTGGLAGSHVRWAEPATGQRDETK